MDAAGSIQNDYQYDAFGQRIPGQENIPNRLRYNAQIEDDLTGLYYLCARYYNTGIGRFTQEDVIYNDALLHTKSNTTAGNFVSTSGDIVIATEFAGKNGYVYVIRTNNYVDINSIYGAGAYFPEQMEFSIPGGIKPYEIVGAYKKQGGKIIGDFIPNPNFGGN